MVSPLYCRVCAQTITRVVITGATPAEAQLQVQPCGHIAVELADVADEMLVAAVKQLIKDYEQQFALLRPEVR